MISSSTLTLIERRHLPACAVTTLQVKLQHVMHPSPLQFFRQDGTPWYEHLFTCCSSAGRGRRGGSGGCCRRRRRLSPRWGWRWRRRRCCGWAGSCSCCPSRRRRLSAASLCRGPWGRPPGWSPESCCGVAPEMRMNTDGHWVLATGVRCVTLETGNFHKEVV